MLRATYTKKISQKDETVLKTNHNYFVRTAIAAVAKICLAGGIVFALSLLVSMVALSSNSEKTDESSVMTVTWISLIFYFAFFIYIIVTAANLLSLYKRLNQIESSIFGDKVARSSASTYRSSKTEEDEEEF